MESLSLYFNHFLSIRNACQTLSIIDLGPPTKRCRSFSNICDLILHRIRNAMTQLTCPSGFLLTEERYKEAAFNCNSKMESGSNSPSTIVDLLLFRNLKISLLYFSTGGVFKNLVRQS